VQRRLDQAGEHFRVASRQLARPDAVAQESPVTRFSSLGVHQHPFVEFRIDQLDLQEA